MKSLLFPILASAALATSAHANDTAFTEHETEGAKYRIFKPKAERKSYKLLVFLPGGDGSAGFTPWCQTIYRLAIPDDFLAVQMIAPPWNTRNNVWPSDHIPTPEMEEPIDDVFGSIVRMVGKTHEIDKDSVFTFSWSSGGPAAYLIAATQPEVKGHFIAMSVFQEEWLPEQLRKVKGQRFYIYHSPEDTVCEIKFARKAKETLGEEKAEMMLKTYPGGHGWTEGPDHFAAIREGFSWLTAED